MVGAAAADWSTPSGWEATDLPCGPTQRPSHKTSARHTKRGLTHAQHHIPVQYTYTYLCNRTA